MAILSAKNSIDSMREDDDVTVTVISPKSRSGITTSDQNYSPRRKHNAKKMFG